jgi:hypothetical protein
MTDTPCSSLRCVAPIRRRRRERDFGAPTSIWSGSAGSGARQSLALLLTQEEQRSGGRQTRGRDQHSILHHKVHYKMRLCQAL